MSYGVASAARDPQRRPSAQQLAAAHRRMVQEQRREDAQRDVDHIEAELQATLDAWRALPVIPNAEEFAQTLAVRPFTSSEAAPSQPDLRARKAPFRKQLVLRARDDKPQGWSRFAWMAAAAIPLLALGSSRLGPGIVLALFFGGVTWALARLTWHARIFVVVHRKLPGEWQEEIARLQADHQARVEAYAARVAVQREQWVASEQDRIAEGRRVSNGDLAAIDRAISVGLAALDFPFEAECAAGIDEEGRAMIDIDLPEIEDVIPETRLTVARDGSRKETRRKAADRNDAYSTLVAGIAFTVAATALAAAPTVQVVTVAGHTQRKTRSSLDAIDAYVYEVRFPREAFARLDAARMNPVQAIQRLPSRIELTAAGALKKLPEPKWAEALWSPGA